MKKRIIDLDGDSDEAEPSTGEKDAPPEIPVSRLAAFTTLLCSSPPFLSISEDTVALLNAQDTESMVKEMRARVHSSLLPASNPLPLTSAQYEHIAHHLMNKENFKKDSIILSRKTAFSSSIYVDAKSFARLLDSKTWLDESLLNAIGALLVQKNAHVAFLETYFWPLDSKLVKVDPSRIAERLFNRENTLYLRQCEYIFSPLNTGSHWVLLVLKPRTGEMNFYDSFHVNWLTYEAKCPHMKTCLDLLVKKLKELYPTHRWSTVTSIETYPTQWDIFSCGVYVMHAMECFAYEAEETELALDSWDGRCFFLRLHYVVSLLNGSLREGTDEDEMSEDLL